MRTGNLLRRWWKAGAVVAAAALGGGAAVAAAAVSDSSGVVHACVDVTTTSGGATVPNQSRANVTVIDPSAGQHCIPPDGPAVPNQTAVSWGVTGPQGPPGTPGVQGPTGARGATGNGVTNSVTIAPPQLKANAKPVAALRIGSGAGEVASPILAAEQAGAAARTIGTGRVTHSDFSITRKLDKSSPTLYQWAASGKHIPKVTIRYDKRPGAVKYLRITLTDAVISSVQTQASAGDKTVPTETISFNYGKIQWVYTQQKRSDGSGSGATTIQKSAPVH